MLTARGVSWLDAAFVDQPATREPTPTALQMKTSDPNTVCTAYRGNGERAACRPYWCRYSTGRDILLGGDRVRYRPGPVDRRPAASLHR